MLCHHCGQDSESTGTTCPMCRKPFLVGEPATQNQQPFAETTVLPVRRAIGTVSAVFIVLGYISFFFFNMLSSAGFLGHMTSSLNPIDEIALEQDHQGWEAYYTGDLSGAVEKFELAASNAVTPEVRVMTRLDLGTFYQMQDRPADALNIYHEAKSLAVPQSFDYYFASGRIASLNGNSDDAMKNYLKAYDINPKDTSINLTLSRMYLNVNNRAPGYTDPKKGLFFAERAYLLDGHRADHIKSNLAYAHMDNGNYPQAIELLQTMNFTYNAEDAYNLGVAYERLNDIANAKKYYRIAYKNGYMMSTDLVSWIEKE